MPSEIKRLDVYKVDFGTPLGSEAGFERPAIVVQSDEFNAALTTTVVIPVTSSGVEAKAKHANNVFLESGEVFEKDSVAQAHLARHVELSRLLNLIGSINAEQGREIDLALSRVLDLEEGWW